MDLKTLAAKAIEEWNAKFARGEITEQQCREGIQRIQEAEGVKGPAFDEAAERAAFEEWADEKGFCLDCAFFEKGNNFEDQATAWLFECWLACAKRKAGVL